jgi:hypothetical protein
MANACFSVVYATFTTLLCARIVGRVSQSKLTSQTVSPDTLFKKRGSLGKERAAKLKELRENKLRDIYEAALKTPGSRELTVEEAEKFIRPYESASDALKADIEKSLRSSKP